MDIKLSKPLTHDGNKIEKVTLDLDKLTGADVLFCEGEAVVMTGMLIPNMKASGAMHVQLAAQASGLPVAVLQTASARDYIAILEAVQGFLTV